MPVNAEVIRVQLRPAIETVLSAQMLGQITELNVALGQSVAAGQILVKFDCSEGEARLAMVKAEQIAAGATLKAKIRMRELNAVGEIEVLLAKAEADRVTASVSLAQAQLGPCQIKAPFSGRVVRVSAKPFQSVGVGSLLLELVSDGILRVRLNIPSFMLAKLKQGQRFNIDIGETGKRYTASVSAINARVDAVAQTIELEGVLDNNYPELLSGMSGVAHFNF